MPKQKDQPLRCPKTGRFTTKPSEALTTAESGQQDLLDPIAVSAEDNKPFKSEVSGSKLELAKTVGEARCVEFLRTIKIELSSPEENRPVDELVAIGKAENWLRSE